MRVIMRVRFVRDSGPDVRGGEVWVPLPAEFEAPNMIPVAMFAEDPRGFVISNFRSGSDFGPSDAAILLLGLRVPGVVVALRVQVFAPEALENLLPTHVVHVGLYGFDLGLEGGGEPLEEEVEEMRGADALADGVEGGSDTAEPIVVGVDVLASFHRGVLKFTPETIAIRGG